MSDNANGAPPLIYAAMAACLADVREVGKSGTNRDQGYKFRSIEDVTAAIHEAFAKNGVFHLPTVLERMPETRQARNGNPINVTHLKIRYDFYARDGSSVAAEVWGEGQDSADKSTNKAMSAADKYALVQAFSISAGDIADSDRGAEEAGPASGYRSGGRGGEASPFDQPAGESQGSSQQARRQPAHRSEPGQQAEAASEPVTDQEWFGRISQVVATFKTQAEGRELWKQVAEKRRSAQCTSADAEQLGELIKARKEELDATASAEHSPATPVPALDGMDPWAVAIEGLGTPEEVENLRADFEEQCRARKIQPGRAAQIAAALNAKAATFGSRQAVTA